MISSKQSQNLQQSCLEACRHLQTFVKAYFAMIYFFDLNREVKFRAVTMTRQFNQMIQQKASSEESCYLSPQAVSSQQHIPPTCSPQDSHPFESLRPWFFKPRKSKYELQDGFKKIKKYNSLHWSQEQNERYVQFLKSFSDLINGDILQKRKYHLNRMLSKCVGSRSPVQCRSHHQKMIKALKTTQAIISHFENPTLVQIPNSTPIDSGTALSYLQDNIRPSQEIYGTQGIPYQQKEEKKVFRAHDLLSPEEASLWDVLTYPILQDSFNDL